VPDFQTLTFRDLGGEQTRKALDAFNIDEAVAAVGGYYDTHGSFIKRKGGEKYNTTALGAAVSGLFDFRYSNDTQQLFLIYSGTTLYQGNAGAPLALQTGLPSGAFPDFEIMNEYCFSCYGGSADLYKLKGTTSTNGGITRPAAAPGAAAAAGGSLANGTYLIRFTYVNDTDPNFLIESNPSDQASVTLGGANGTIALSLVTASPDTQTTKRYIYITTAGGSILKFAVPINDNVTTTINITADATGVLLEYTHDTAPTGLKGLEQFRGRLVGFKNNFLYLTIPYKPWYWPQGLLDQFTNLSYEIGNTDDIIGIKTFYDVVLIFKRSTIYIFSGLDETSFTAARLQTDERVGCVSDRTLKVIGNYCFFVGVNSVYRTNGVTVDDVGGPIADYFDEFTTQTTYKINKSFIQNSCAESIKDKNLYNFFYTPSPDTNNSMCLSLDASSIRVDQATGKVTCDWARWPGFTTQAVAVVKESGYDRWFRSDQNGYVFRQDRLDGDGSNITSSVTSAGASTLTDTLQSWTVNLYAGLPVYILSGQGSGQVRNIVSNTGTQLTVDSPWATTPDTSSVYSIGGIPFYYQHGWHDYGNPSLSKRWRYARPRFDTTGSFNVNVSYGYDFTQSDLDVVTIGLASLSLWDQGMWDQSSWDGTYLTQNLNPLKGNRVHRWSSYKIENSAAGQPVKYNGMDKIFMFKGLR